MVLDIVNLFLHIGVFTSITVYYIFCFFVCKDTNVIDRVIFDITTSIMHRMYEVRFAPYPYCTNVLIASKTKKMNPSLLLGLVGFFSFASLWPLLFLADAAGLESLEVPGGHIMLLLMREQCTAWL